uniref:Uncharacterized protein n=1 Tax=Ditylenchus dipsaci TaxID=166011 RepID=A0A915ED47_9BILA
MIKIAKKSLSSILSTILRRKKMFSTSWELNLAGFGHVPRSLLFLTTSFSHHGSYLKAARESTRLVIATFFWNFCTHAFMRIDHHTGMCLGATNATSYSCADEGGSWIPGFDISGHTFLLIYSSLIISEEAKVFYNWPAAPRATTKHIPSVTEYENFKKLSKWIQYWFVGLFLLQLFWDFQLMVTVLYYHTLLSKFMGAVIAVMCWYSTYYLWFPLAFPFKPIRRHIKSF